MKQILSTLAVLIILSIAGCHDGFPPTNPQDPPTNPTDSNTVTNGLQNVKWCLMSIEEGGRIETVGASNTTGDARPSIAFDNANGASGNAGCNHFSATYTAVNGGLSIRNISATKIACGSNYETRFLAALATAQSYEITATGTLRIHYTSSSDNAVTAQSGVLDLQPCS